MNESMFNLFFKAIIEEFTKYQKEWLTAHNDIEFEQPEEDLILAFLDDTANSFISEYTE